MRRLLPALVLLVACGKEPAPTAPAPTERAPETATAPTAPAPAAVPTEPAAAPDATKEAAPEVAPSEPTPAPAATPMNYVVDWTYEPEDRQRHVKTLIPRADGTLIALGGSNRPGEMHVRMTALDTNGKVLWDKTHGDTIEVSSLQNGGGLALPDGGFVVVGRRMSSDLKVTAWLGGFDKDGNSTWELALTTPESYTIASWVMRPDEGRVLVATERGDAAKPTHELHLVSLSDRTFTTTAALGQVGLPERQGAAWAAMVWTYPETGPKSEAYTIDKAGVLTPSSAQPTTNGWSAAAGDSVLVTSVPLGDKRLLVTRGHGDSAMVTLVLSDDSGARLWRHFIEDAGFDQVTVIQPTSTEAGAAGFAIAMERWATDSRGLRNPDGYRIVQFR